MVTFNSFANILPDPVNKITDSGDIDPTGVAGPGFAGVNFASNGETQVSRTNSGRGVSRDQGRQWWSFSIRYNPMLRDQFDPVDTFLASRNARRDPFYVVLPQYSKPKDSTFNAFALSNTLHVEGDTAAGATNFMLNCTAVINGNPRPGDMFTITDAANANHKKVYKVTRVETSTRYQAGTTAPTTHERRVHINPPLQRFTSNNSIVNFINPLFRVVMKGDVREYELTTENLYNFSLDLEELQP
jgi:hypothetical protein